MVDMVQQLGELALASRMRRIVDSIFQDVSSIYKEEGIPFEPRWFLLYMTLYRQNGAQSEPLSVGDLAKAQGTSHPAVNQIAQEMVKAGLLVSEQDSKDKRRRLLSLTPKAKSLYPELQRLTHVLERCVHDVITETGHDVLGVLGRMESVLSHASFHERYCSEKQRQSKVSIEIVPYESAFKKAFFTLNQAWIEPLFGMEEPDYQQLLNPEEEILKPGGHVFFAQIPGIEAPPSVVGTCALVRHDEQTYELAKMAVSSAYRGCHIGERLIQHAIKQARADGMTAVILETNSQLAPALELYRKMGFVRQSSRFRSPYVRADIRMRLDLLPQADSSIGPARPVGVSVKL